MIYIENKNGELVEILGFKNEAKASYEPYIDLVLEDDESGEHLRRTEGQDLKLNVNGRAIEGKFKIDGDTATFYRKYV